MPTYIFRCQTHGEFEVYRGFDEPTSPVNCPICGSPARRVYQPIPDIWHCDGAHKTDYGRGVNALPGDKRDVLNRRWKEAWKEDPPPPAPDVPKNRSEKY